MKFWIIYKMASRAEHQHVDDVDCSKASWQGNSTMMLRGYLDICNLNRHHPLCRLSSTSHTMLKLAPKYKSFCHTCRACNHNEWPQKETHFQWFNSCSNNFNPLKFRVSPMVLRSDKTEPLYESICPMVLQIVLIPI